MVTKQVKLLALTLLSIIYWQSAMADLGQAMDICKKLQTLSPDADPSAYEALAQQFKQAGLTACSCTKFLTAERIAAEREQCSMRWGITAQDWQAIDMRKARVEYQDGQPGAMTCAVDSRLNAPASFKDDVVKMFMEIGCHNGHIDIRLNTDLDSENVKSVRKVILAERYYPGPYGTQVIIPINNFNDLVERCSAHDHALYLGSEFMQLDDRIKKGALLHEINGHVVHGDSLETFLLICLIGNSSLSDQMAGLNCAYEARADQVSAACGSIDDALCLQASLMYLNEKYGKTYDKNEHDSPAKRVVDVTKIVNLRQALAQLDA